MQPPPALPQLINSAPAGFSQQPSLTPSTLVAQGGQIQGSEAEDLTTLLPSLVCQPCRLWQSAGLETQGLLGRGEVHNLTHQALGSREASPLEGRAQPPSDPNLPLFPGTPRASGFYRRRN